MISIRQHTHRKSIRDIVMFAALTFSSFTEPHSFTISSSTTVHHIPHNLVLKNVVLFTRHGDRGIVTVYTVIRRNQFTSSYFRHLVL